MVESLSGKGGNEMTLGFSTKWPDRMGDMAGQPNYFIEKIWASMPDDLNRNTYLGYGSKCRDVLRECWDGYYDVGKAFKPKLHTIRRDSHNRWKPGMDIHMVINNRTKDRFQFAPVVKCKSVQDIDIVPTERYGFVRIDGRELDMNEIIELARNDGFPTVESFFMYFNDDFSGKLIHWADLKY